MIRTITIKMKPDELATIIKDYLSKEGFEVSEKNIRFNLETVYEGFGINEYATKKFTGCSVDCNLKTKGEDDA